MGTLLPEVQDGTVASSGHLSLSLHSTPVLDPGSYALVRGAGWLFWDLILEGVQAGPRAQAVSTRLAFKPQGAGEPPGELVRGSCPTTPTRGLNL